MSALRSLRSLSCWQYLAAFLQSLCRTSLESKDCCHHTAPQCRHIAMTASARQCCVTADCSVTMHMEADRSSTHARLSKSLSDCG